MKSPLESFEGKGMSRRDAETIAIGLSDLKGQHIFIAANASFPRLECWHLEKRTFPPEGDGKPQMRKILDVPCSDCDRLRLNDGEWHEMGD
jgi:hypothetical protein